jgi:hypothetical protein
VVACRRPRLSVARPPGVDDIARVAALGLPLELLYLILKVSNSLHSLSVLNILLGEETDNPVDVPSSSSETTSQVIRDNSTKVL